MKIILDGFGGDNAPEEAIKGAVDALKADGRLKIVVTGDKEKIEEILKRENADLSRIEIIDAKEVITNDESPTMAVKLKKDSSLVRGLDRMNADDADAFVSAGSTGAVLTGAFMKIGRIKGISRPALAPVLPTLKGNGVVLCDCGANVDCKPVQIRHFAVMGKAYAEAMLGVKDARVGLLSNGAEDKKGNELNREAFALLKEDEDLNFIGNCEARDILSGDFDVVAADGFNGNIALKSAEGTANAIFSILMDKINEGGLKAKLGALLLKPALKEVKRKMDYNSAGGACFLGLNKVVVKAHGSSKRKAFCAAILQASSLAESDLCNKIKDGISLISDEHKQD